MVVKEIDMSNLIQCVHSEPFCPSKTTCGCICTECQYYSRKWLEQEADRVLAEAFASTIDSTGEHLIGHTILNCTIASGDACWTCENANA